MRFRMLDGPVEIWHEGHGHPTGTIKEQYVLAILLMDAGRAVSLQSLANRLWDDAPPRNAKGNIQAYISRLRKRFREAGGDGRLIASTSAGGYRLDVPVDDIDAKRFEHLVHRAMAARATDPPKARELLREAQDLWGGGPLAGIEGEWAENTRKTLNERRRTATLTRIELELDIGGHGDDLISELTALNGGARVDEPVVRLLMRALAAAGRAQEALDSYREAWVRLQKRGMDPGMELKTLQQQILSGKAPTPSNVGAAGGGSPAPSLLDPNPRHLNGRDRDMDELLARVTRELRDGSGPVFYAIDGMPGVGKTSFALRAAHRLSAHFPDGLLQVNMRTHRLSQSPLGVRDAQEQLLRGLAVSDQQIERAESEDALAALWRRQTSRRRILVFLDDVANAEQIERLLPTSTGSVVLLTSRRRLAGLPEVRQQTLETLSDTSSGEMLTALIGRELPDLAAGLDRFARLCGGLPQAIVLAAGLLDTHRTWTLADLNDRLAAAPAGHADDQVGSRMNAMFAASVEVLPEHLQTLLCLMAVHPGSDVEPLAAAALTGDDVAGATFALETLQEHRLVLEKGTNRYRLHDLLRQFALVRLDQRQSPAETDRALRRLIDVYAAKAVRADDAIHPHRHATTHIPAHDSPAVHWAGRSVFDTPGRGRGWLDTEQTNLIAVSALAHQRGWLREAAMLPLIVAEHLDRRGQWHRALRILQRTQDAWTATAPPEPGTANTARLLTDLAAAYIRGRADLDLALTLAERAVEAWTACGDRHGLADAMVQVGRCHWEGRRPTRAVDAYETAIRLYEETGDPARQAKTQLNLGIQLYEIGQTAAGFTLGTRALATVGLDDAELRCDVLTDLGEMHRQSGHIEEALALFDEGLPIAESLADPHNIGVLASNIGAAYAARGEYGTAESSFHRALEIFRRQGDRGQQVDTLLLLADAHTRREHHAVTLHLLATASELAESMHDPLREARVLRAAGDAQRSRGDLAAAAGSYQASLRQAEQAEGTKDQIKALRAMGEVLELLQDAEAEHYTRQAEALERQLDESGDTPPDF